MPWVRRSVLNCTDFVGSDVARSGRQSAQLVLIIVAGVATVTFVVVGVAACGVALLRATGRIGRATERNMPFQDRTTIEGVVVDSTDVSPHSLRTDGDAR